MKTSCVEPRVLRRGLLDNGYIELPITSEHAVSVDALPPLHKDPFDRLLLAQPLTYLANYTHRIAISSSYDCR